MSGPPTGGHGSPSRGEAGDTDKLAQIEARDVGTGPRFLTLWEQSALVEIAKAARDIADYEGVENGGAPYVFVRKDEIKALAAALSALDGDT